MFNWEATCYQRGLSGIKPWGINPGSPGYQAQLRGYEQYCANRDLANKINPSGQLERSEGSRPEPPIFSPLEAVEFMLDLLSPKETPQIPPISAKEAAQKADETRMEWRRAYSPEGKAEETQRQIVLRLRYCYSEISKASRNGRRSCDVYDAVEYRASCPEFPPRWTGFLAYILGDGWPSQETDLKTRRVFYSNENNLCDFSQDVMAILRNDGFVVVLDGGKFKISW